MLRWWCRSDQREPDREVRNVGTKPAIQAANRLYRDSFTRREGKADIERGRTIAERINRRLAWSNWRGSGQSGEEAISRREMVGWARGESERGEESRGGMEGGREEGA